LAIESNFKTNFSDLFEYFSEKSSNLTVAEIRRAAEETSVPEKSYRVAFLGGAQVGKTSIIDQGSNKREISTKNCRQMVGSLLALMAFLWCQCDPGNRKTCMYTCLPVGKT
jgi:hypothetical protein